MKLMAMQGSGKVAGSRVLVIGGSGFVGRQIMNYFSCSGTSLSGEPNFIKLDIRDPGSIKKVLMETSPKIVVNSSGLTNVDYCETHESEAMEINGNSIGYIADAAEEIGASLFHISTDYVFSGDEGNYSEEDIPYPVNVYGRSKLLGENMLKGRKCVIIRISTPYGINNNRKKSTFMEFILSNIRKGQRIRVITDQFTTPTYIDEIAPAIAALNRAGRTGIFHLGSRECVSRYQFSMLISDIFSLNGEMIIPAKTSELGLAARRPLNCCMKTTKIGEYVETKGVRENLLEIKEKLK